MSPYVQPLDPPEDGSVPDEQMLECTECEFVGAISEFLPENMR